MNTTMRIMTWNVWWRFGDNWLQRQRAIGAALRQLEPDVVGLQETWAGDGTSQPEVLGRELSLHAAFAAPSLPPVPVPPEHPDQQGIELGVGLLSRWPISRVRQERLPAVHGQRPVAMVATLEHEKGPFHVVVSCVEWRPERRDDQLTQTEALRSIIEDASLEGPLPVILVADLNAAPETPQIRNLTEVAVDVWRIAGRGNGITLGSDNTHVRKEASIHADQRIDYILARPGRSGADFQVKNAFVFRDTVDGVFPSDHYAVVADLIP